MLFLCSSNCSFIEICISLDLSILQPLNTKFDEKPFSISTFPFPPGAIENTCREFRRFGITFVSGVSFQRRPILPALWIFTGNMFQAGHRPEFLPPFGRQGRALLAGMRPCPRPEKRSLDLYSPQTRQ